MVKELCFRRRCNGECSGRRIGNVAELKCFEIAVVSRQGVAGAHRDSLVDVG